MPRTVEEWRGKTDDEPVPPRVRMRVLLRADRLCAKCTRVIRPGDEWACDHVVALINSGENRERNLQALCSWCDPTKTRADLATKSKTYRMGARHAGVRSRQSRPMPGTRASGWKQKMNGTCERLT